MMMQRYLMNLWRCLHALLAMTGMPLWQFLHLRKALKVCGAIRWLPLLPLFVLFALLTKLRAMLNSLRKALNGLRAVLYTLRLPRDKLRTPLLPLRPVNKPLLLAIDY
jgi:hypothetical protein